MKWKKEAPVNRCACSSIPHVMRVGGHLRWRLNQNVTVLQYQLHVGEASTTIPKSLLSGPSCSGEARSG